MEEANLILIEEKIEIKQDQLLDEIKDLEIKTAKNTKDILKLKQKLRV